MFGGGTRGGRAGPGLAVLLATAALAVLGPGAGSADAAASCGGRQVKTVRFATGELRVYKTHGYACALAVAKSPGARRQMAVTIQARGGGPVSDSGRFTQQAGPVTVHAINRCVRASGSVAGSGGSTGWILC
ncbi:hypothetical protein [Streptomyces melanogenes]|uniref:Secreted protein n=1 Tax=Streptomyces melanogenes TaxID=67326 RepID=A0ABZ1XKI9_9ACTN|nr:hypothetical protein [Streptomyces melanogenes]